MLKKIFITGGIALAAYVLNGMRKEYDKNVSDYNDLVEKYNVLLQSKKEKQLPDVSERFKKEVQVMPDGSQITVTHDSVRRLRNACAHNFCLLTSFKPVQWFKPDLETSFELLGGNLGISNGTISSCMKVPLLNDFAVMLSVYTKLISSPKIKELTLQELKDFFDGRMVYKKQYFENYTEIKNAYNFARKVLDYYSGK